MPAIKEILHSVKHNIGPAVILIVFLAAAFSTRLTPLEELLDISTDGGRQLSFVDLVDSISNFPARVEADFNRSFTGRDALVRANYRFRFNVLGERNFHDVVVGKDGWLYYSGERNLDYYQRANLMSAEQIGALLAQLSETRENLTAQGITFYVVVAPNKESIYPEHLPAGIRQANGPSLLDEILAANRDPDLKIIDLRPALMKAREDTQVYYRTDTHWNPEGAFAAYEVIAERIGADFPAVKAHPPANFIKVRESIGGDLSAMLTMKDELVEDSFELEPAFDRKALTETSEDDAVLKSINSDSSLPRTMIFRDSFFNGLQPFLMEHFSKAIVIRSFNLDMEWIAAEKPDIVIMEVAERYLPELVKPPE
jgi:alginate O-acetyltransferase complex protein AlgJ